MGEVKPLGDCLIEVSYEIVAKLGGIHTVIKTKSPFMKKYYGDNYLVVGLYEKGPAKKGFKKQKPTKDIKYVFDKLKKEGIVCYYGRWNIKSQPKAILLDITKIRNNKKLKEKISITYWVNFLKKRTMYNDAMLFSYAAGMFISELVKMQEYKSKKVVVNLHEYMCALTLFYLRKHKSNVPIVFTTHATALGRALAFAGINIYNEVISSKKNKYLYNKKLETYLSKLGNQVYNKHFQERACAKHADVFTTVSEVTSKEAGFLLDKKADVITPNGLEVIKYPNIEEQLAINYKAKVKIHKFLQSYFSPYYQIKEKDDCLFFFTSGRNEIYTKGYDLFFESLKRLNDRLKKKKFKKDVFVFLFIMVEGKKERDIVVDALRTKSRMRIKKRCPPNFAFNVKNDKVLAAYHKKNKLQNKKDDRVKVIFYPAPATEHDKLLSMPYQNIISGMNLGIFPSLYEPWGYTPLETASMSTPTITTDVAGFGKFIKKRSDQRKLPGIVVLRTKGRSRTSIITHLARIMYEIANIPKEEVIKKRIEANKLASLANWEDFSKQYIKAHNLAFKRHKK